MSYLRKSLAGVLLIFALATSSMSQAQTISSTGTPGPENSSLSQEYTTFLPNLLNPCIHCYYVDSINGSDANPGTSKSQPWKTLARVHATNFQPGDVIHFKRGSSWTGGLVIDNSGVQGNWITFTTYGDGERPVFTNPGTQDNITQAVIINANWIILEGFLVQNTSGAGVRITQTSNNDVVQNIEAMNTGIGITVSGTHHLITNNYVHDLHLVRNTPGGIDDYGAIGVDLVDASYTEISYNRMVNCKAPSYDFGTDGGAVEWFGHSDNNYVHHNWANEDNGFFEVGGGSALNNLVSYNVSVNNGIFGLFNLTGEFATTVENFRIENNTIVETDSGRWVVFGFVGYPSASTMLLRNNIIYLDDIKKNVSLKSGFTHEYNLYYLTGGANVGFPLGTGDFLADPLFVNFANQDYHLQNGSPAIDAGLDLGHTLDFDNELVPAGIAPDLGAFEYRPPPIPGVSPPGGSR